MPLFNSHKSENHRKPKRKMVKYIIVYQHVEDKPQKLFTSQCSTQSSQHWRLYICTIYLNPLPGRGHCMSHYVYHSKLLHFQLAMQAIYEPDGTNYTIPYYLFTTHFNIISPRKPVCSQLSLSFRFSSQNPVCISPLCHKWHMTYDPHISQSLIWSPWRYLTSITPEASHNYISPILCYLEN